MDIFQSKKQKEELFCHQNRNRERKEVADLTGIGEEKDRKETESR